MPKYFIEVKSIDGAKLKHLAAGTATVTKEAKYQKPDGRTWKPVRELRDTQDKGFFIRLNPNCTKGGKHTYNGQREDGSKFKIGYVGDITVKQARDACKAEREAAAARPSIATTATNTLSYCFEDWKIANPMSKSARFDPVTQEKCARKAPKTIQLCEHYLNRFSGDWMDRTIASITAKEILGRARQIDEEVSRNSAHQWLKQMSAVVNATTTFHDTVNRFQPILAKHYPAAHAGHRALSDEEIEFVLNVSRDHFRFTTTRPGSNRNEGDLDFHAWRKMLALKFLLLSGFRIGGVASLKVKEINCKDIHRPEADKTGRPHTLPITSQLRELLDECLAIKNGKDEESPDDWPREIVDSEFLFSTNDGRKYGAPSKDLFGAARNLLSKCYTLPKIQGKKMRKAEVMRAHDFRVTLNTLAARLKISEELREGFLGHSKGETLNDRYTDQNEDDRKADFDNEREALQATHDELFKIGGLS